MKDSRNWVQHCLDICSCVSLALAGLLVLQPALIAAADKGYESAPVLSASKILPPELLAGPNHHVEERVYNDGYLNRYTVQSKFGGFVAVSTPMLRKRINEINAMVRMEQIEGTKEFTASLKEAGTDTLVGFKNLVSQPVDTVKGAASGLAVAFRRAGDALTGPKRSDAEDSKIKDLIGFSKTKREYAYQLGVDAYTDNEKLQDRLNEISWAGYAGGITWTAAMSAVPGGAGLAISISGMHKLLNEVFRTTPPADLRRMNAEKLEAMGKLLTAADARVTQSTRPANKQLWVTGTVSARAKKEIESRGWQVQEQSEERLLSWTEDYPKYEKPEERIPAGFIMLNIKSVGVGVGGSSGDGVLSYQGKDYPFTISGFNVADLGVSSFQGAGKIYELKVLNDFSGNYAAAQAAFAVRGGQSELSMRNGKGVTIVILQDEG